MNQTLHIFAKDARRFWAEIFISVALTAAFVSIGRYLWTGAESYSAGSVGVLAILLGMLVPVSWWILITRGIQAERLVGDTQFWITRPYRWDRLLAAKVLFLLVFLYVPYFIAQCLLLVEAGFAPQDSVAGLLFDAMLLTGVLILPLAAIATVTSNFARMTLTLLGILLGFIALAIAGSTGFSKQGGGPESSVGISICFVLAAVFVSAAILLQYSLRRVWVTRGVLLALPVLLLSALNFASKYDQAQVDRIYPAALGATPIQLAYSPSTGGHEKVTLRASSSAMVPINLRFAETGIAEGYAVMPDDVRVEISAPDGSHWNTDWLRGGGYRFLRGESQFTEGISMPKAIYNKYKSMPLSVHVDFAITQAQAGKVTAVPMPLERVSVPELGICTPINWTQELGQAVGLHCVAAVREPQLTYISTRWSEGPCSGAPTAPDAGTIGTGWAGSLDPTPGQLNLYPIVDLNVNLSNSHVQEANGGSHYLCVGTPVAFTQYKAVRRMQTSVDIKEFHLPPISVAGNMITITQ